MATTGTSDLFWDFAHFVPAEQLGTHGALEGSGVSSWSLLETDPTIPRVAPVSAGFTLNGMAASQGPVPFVAKPGVNAVYVVRGENSGLTNNALQAFPVSFYYSPRYHQP